jgi:WD40 repeat protein
VNAVKPSLTLGQSSLKAKAKKRRTKRDGSAQGHSAAVLCLDWNPLAQHVLASGGADQAVVLWDLDEAKASTVISLESMVGPLEFPKSDNR